jgi:predicted nucleic acid-binding protein
MDVLADTSVLLRFVSPDDPKHRLVVEKIGDLSEAGHRICFTPQIARQCWQDLVQRYGVSGKQVHDANHVAAMLEHGISQILTLDKRDFERYTEISVQQP